ncbi:PQQ-dependent sugar dehydrogenase [Streptomyces sp. NPDC051940]|uniref:PQQ-dependent sugar dehydrogenase n=1 Tax=Streptomyces sp. NPDC051940 TaxID=3155675 RepID=UPI0034180754
MPPRRSPARPALLTAALAAALVTAPVHQARAADPPLSQGRPASASSVLSASTTAAAAVDGDPATAWRGETTGPHQWISVDLGAMSTINHVQLQWQDGCAAAHTLQTSPDGAYWQDIHRTTDGTGGTEDIDVTGYGRHLRLYADAACLPDKGYALAELKVYGTPGIADHEPPTPPGPLRSTAATATSVALAWEPADDNVGVTAYDIYQQGQFVKSVDGTQLSTNMTRLSPSTSYGFYVNARDAAGNVSQAGNTVWATTTRTDTTAPTAPGAPHSPGATANSVTLAWEPATDDVAVTGYTVFRDGLQIATATGTEVTIHGLPPQTEGTFTVRAADGARNLSPLSEPVTASTRTGVDAVGEVTQVTRGTDVPWGMAFLPDGSALTAERDSFRVVRVTPDGGRTVAGTVPDAQATDGEGGLLGLELSPDFAADHWVYLFHTTATDNRIVRIKYTDGTLDLTTREVLLTGIARNKFHDGGRLRFGPDGKLYAATGDAQRAANAQDLHSLNGKILRLEPDGSVPADNPFPGSYVWSYGHRNVQGLAFDSRGRLWQAELGNSVMDEMNLIRRGGNYGWPVCEGTSGDCGDPTFIAPVRTWAVSAASPSGLAIVDDTLYVAALRGTQLWRMRITGDTTTTPEAYFTGTYGRLRTVEPTPDGDLWLTTSNGDKDSVPDNSDTAILRVPLNHPGKLVD